MPLWDSADLLARVKRFSRLPVITEWPRDEDWYAWLTEAEAKWKPVLALHAPGSMMIGPVKMRTTDGGLTYLLPRRSSIVWDRAYWNVNQWNAVPPAYTEPPLYFELMPTRAGVPLIAGAYWDAFADYVNEGDRVRMCRGRPRTFADGPWARYVPPAGLIDADHESTIEPKAWRILLVFDTMERFATAGGKGDVQDPDYWRGKLQKELSGDDDIPGDLGILGRAKLQDGMGGLVGRTDSPTSPRRRWWQPA